MKPQPSNHPRQNTFDCTLGELISAAYTAAALLKVNGRGLTTRLINSGQVQVQGFTRAVVV